MQNVEAKLGEHSAHIENMRQEQNRVRGVLEDLTKSHRVLVSKGESIEQKVEHTEQKIDNIDKRLEAMGARHGNDEMYLVRLIRNNLDRISIWLVLILVLVQLLGKEDAIALLKQGFFGS